MLPSLRLQTEAAIAPADNKSRMVAIAEVIDFGRAFNVSIPDVRAVTERYREHLADLPADLLVNACREACRNWRWGNRLPMPADIRAAVAEEFAHRKLVLLRIGMAEDRVQRARREAEAHRARGREIDRWLAEPFPTGPAPLSIRPKAKRIQPERPPIPFDPEAHRREVERQAAELGVELPR